MKQDIRNNNKDCSNSNEILSTNLRSSEEVQNDYTTEELSIINGMRYFTRNDVLEDYIKESENDGFKSKLQSEINRRNEWFVEQTDKLIGHFTKNEWNFMIDSFNGIYIPFDDQGIYSDPNNVCSMFSDSIEFENLDVKWGITSDILFKKIFQLPEGTILNVILVIDYWWINGSLIGKDFVNQLTDEEKCINNDSLDKLSIKLEDDSHESIGNKLNINNVKL
jgi:hypothetical protein